MNWHAHRGLLPASSVSGPSREHLTRTEVFSGCSASGPFHANEPLSKFKLVLITVHMFPTKELRNKVNKPKKTEKDRKKNAAFILSLTGACRVFPKAKRAPVKKKNAGPSRAHAKSNRVFPEKNSVDTPPREHATP